MYRNEYIFDDEEDLVVCSPAALLSLKYEVVVISDSLWES